MRSNRIPLKARIFLIGFILLNASLYPDALEAAKKFEEKLFFIEAVNSYTRWLSENPGANNFTEILLHAASIHPDADKAVGLLESHLPGVKIPENRSRIRGKTASIRELQGNFIEAQKLYELAYFDYPHEVTFPHLFRSARLLFELGDLQTSEEQARVVANLCKDPVLKKKAVFYLARIMAATDRIDESLRIASLLKDDVNNIEGNETILYFIFDVSSRSKREDTMKAAFDGLKKEFPGSLEYRLAELTLQGLGTVKPFPSPSALLNPAGRSSVVSSLEKETVHTIPARTGERKTEPAATAIQTGSFTMRENAEYMVRDLKGYGFNPVIREDDRSGEKKIYKVLVPLENEQRTTEETQHVLIKLKEKGVEGFLLFE